eukprot:CAMPEP_0168625112 /NCGR_PEP_ID=MMETSP0449_2-20121227/9817_1 /TAXON_ID=1082188 /ORGANISM="Strombidium rassoulzadegani, Strain ras09" /LENGTH=79 /DNA_ID=CAMNT_0008666803 /DNA_START=18 /DNA_END=257 /DNA_ORIENTATION=+
MTERVLLPRLTEEEHRRDFESFDTNKDGFVDAQEVRERNPKVSQEDVSAFFIESDKNEDGKVSLDEYLHSQYSNAEVVV